MMSAQYQQQTETFGAVSRFFSIVVFELDKELIGHNKNSGIHEQMTSFPNHTNSWPWSEMVCMVT